MSVFAVPRARRKIVAGNEFHRIKNLPRRIWDENLDVESMTDSLRKLHGKMNLWPVQVAALRDIYIRKGAFLPIGVGRGKTLISLLAPVLLDAKRPLLLVPASLRDQTNQEVLPQMAKHWHLHPKLIIKSSSFLSLAKNAKFLDEYRPDLLILDECHEYKNPKAGRTKRVRRFIKGNPETIVVAMSGTVSNRSLSDYAHIVEWCLGRHNSPVPTTYYDIMDWGCAIDEGVPDEQTVDPGALMQFCKEGENVRQGFRRRLTETPGVIASLGEDGVDASLVITRANFKTPKACSQAINKMQQTWETPDGEIIQTATDLTRHSKELALGFYYRWETTPPKPWMKARREWRQYVQHVLSNNRRGLDTPLQVWNECEENPNVEFFAWQAIKDRFKINTVPAWVDISALEFCIEWLANNEGICWIAHKAFGEALGNMSPYPYFGSGKQASRDIRTVQGPIIASIKAHSVGKNLQRYSRNLVTCPPSTGKTWEQLLGRTHRAGQQADEVSIEVMLHTNEMRASFEQAQKDAVYLEHSLGGRQKLNLARVVT